MNPYESLDTKHFWSSAVARRSMFDIVDLWDPKFDIDKQMKVATFGSCFAQKMGKALESRGFNWFSAEPAPRGMSAENARMYNYGVFSARTGNIYTASLLKQWSEWAAGEVPVPLETWEKEGRSYDPFRPNIEPNGFESWDETIRSRDAAIEAFRKVLTDSQVFVFTLGLTESWVNADHGYEYPMCPGTIAGTFDSQKHQFVNQTFPFIQNALTESFRIIRSLNPAIKFILTVSPVPLAATMSGDHVLVATMESKSVLRAVAGDLRRQLDFVDYFPSYEMICGAPYRGTFFEPDQRNVNHAGVDHVMNTFFTCLNAKFPMGVPAANAAKRTGTPTKLRPVEQRDPGFAEIAAEEAVCEEQLIDAFSRERRDKP
jgi:hypothetical protein